MKDIDKCQLSHAGNKVLSYVIEHVSIGFYVYSALLGRAYPHHICKLP